MANIPPHIPPEIWLYIANFIPDDVLSQMRTVSKVFLELAMDIRWKEATITTKNISQAMRILDRLSDPFVAERLKVLTLHLPTPIPIGNNQILRPFGPENIPSDLMPGVQMPRSSKFGLHTFDDVLEAIISRSRGFVNLRKLTLDFSVETRWLESFFNSLWASVGQRLHGLSLKGNLHGYYIVLGSNPRLPGLRELGLEIINNHRGFDGSMAAVVLLETILPLINRLSSRLQDLRIMLYPPHPTSPDFSQFFLQLSPLPKLLSLDVRVALNNPSGLENILRDNSATLQRLTLRLNPSGSAVLSKQEKRLAPWLLDCLAHPEYFSRVQNLDIYPTREPEGPYITASFIRRTCDRLREFIIRDRYFDLDEIMLVIEEAAECPNLISLEFNVWHLDVALIDHLFAKLPRLENLKILTVESSTDGFPQYFIRDLKTRFYEGWKLREISVCYGDREVDAETMGALARSIPSVDSCRKRM
ncbi:hypothetical protein GALMADRAFT_267734 [Galerina marginata CBS 339.88]|uniref:F-box domain-containing protein n=1 Tax=Galerina marginata (strain CBS 339.88) TaxID=685588 RepID=A0A067SYL4_GALM3|nr:hypothetical protein GALMADRAFT_267734 [Galerina marginata CBS 339.88]